MTATMFILYTLEEKEYIYMGHHNLLSQKIMPAYIFLNQRFCFLWVNS